MMWAEKTTDKRSNNMKRTTPSLQTRMNWLIDAVVFSSGLLAILSGIYFLFLPAGGYQGGRNPMYGVTILFTRHTWDDWHTWTGVAMIAAIVIHFAIHWRWVVTMSKSVVNAILTKGDHLSKGSKFNVAIDVTVAISFLLTAISGIYFLFVPASSGRGTLDPGLIFTRTVWDLIHTWAGVILIGAAIIHFAIHWRWVVKVTSMVISSLRARGNAVERQQLGVSEA
jgi:preprotein translocase subunit SecY